MVIVSSLFILVPPPTFPSVTKKISEFLNWNSKLSTYLAFRNYRSLFKHYKSHPLMLPFLPSEYIQNFLFLYPEEEVVLININTEFNIRHLYFCQLSLACRYYLLDRLDYVHSYAVNFFISATEKFSHQCAPYFRQRPFLLHGVLRKTLWSVYFVLRTGKITFWTMFIFFYPHIWRLHGYSNEVMETCFIYYNISPQN